MSEPVVQVRLPAPIERAWAYFREPELIAEWHGWQTEDLDAEIRQIYRDETRVVEDQRALHIGGHLFELEPDGSETSITVTRASPVEAAGSVDWDQYYEDIDEGWRTFLEQLRFALSHHPGEPRKTIHLGGLAVSPAPEPPLTALGLGHLADAVPGDRYEGVTDFGEGLSGEVWFHTPLQVGLTIDNWGPGLLLLASAPMAEPRHSAAAVTLVTYGLPEIELLASRWTEWWDGHYRSTA